MSEKKWSSKLYQLPRKARMGWHWFQNQERKRQRLLIIALVGIGLLLCFALITAFHEKPQHIKKKRVTVTTTARVSTQSMGRSPLVHPVSSEQTLDFADVQAKLAHIETLLSKNSDTKTNETLQPALIALHHALIQMQQQSAAQSKQLNFALNQLSDQVQQNAKRTHVTLTHLVQAREPKRCVTADKLPFQVVSIDRINGQNVVSVRYGNQITPLERSFSLAGWQLTASNYTQQSATFTNHQKTCAHVNLMKTF